MRINIIENIEFNPVLEDLYDELRISGRDSMIREFHQILQEAESIARPKAMYRSLTIREKTDDYIVVNDERLDSRVLSVNLASTEIVFASVATCGTELELWSQTISNMLHKFWADTICDLGLSAALKEVYRQIKMKFETRYISAMTPGSLEDWPISEQMKLFNLLDNSTAAIDVELTEKYYMKPVKTVSCLVFPSDEQYFNCQLCSRENCPNRRAPFESHLMSNKYRKDTCELVNG